MLSILNGKITAPLLIKCGLFFLEMSWSLAELLYKGKAKVKHFWCFVPESVFVVRAWACVFLPGVISATLRMPRMRAEERGTEVLHGHAPDGTVTLQWLVGPRRLERTRGPVTPLMKGQMSTSTGALLSSPRPAGLFQLTQVPWRQRRTAFFFLPEEFFSSLLAKNHRIVLIAFKTPQI